MKPSNVWHGHSTRRSLPAGTAWKVNGSLLRGRQNRLISPAKKNRKFPLCRVPEEASIVSYSLCARQPPFRLLAFNIAYNIILDFILKSNSLIQKLKKKFQFLEPSLKDAGHLRSTGDALLLKGLFALCAAPMITVMVSRRGEERINIRLDRLYLLYFFFEPVPLSI